MIIKGLQKTTLLDYPGKISCTIFISGCNFHCPFCHNKELVFEEFGHDLKIYSEKEIFDFLKNRVGKLEAVCLTGGEPTIYPELITFIKKIKSLGFLIKLDSNGTNSEMVKKLINGKLVDYIAIDYKGPFNKYFKYTNINFYSSSESGVTPDESRSTLSSSRLRSNNNIIKNKIQKTINILLRSGIEFELRTTVVPTLHTKEDLIKMTKDLNSMIHNSKFIIHPNWFLQQFRPKHCLDSKFEKITPYSDKWFNEVLKELRLYPINVKLRGN